MIERLSSSTSAFYNLETTKIQQQENKGAEERSLEQKDLNKKQLEEIVKSLNDFVQPTHISIQFELHEESEQYYVEVIDENTKEIIREIPSKKMLDIYTAMTEFLGVMFDQKI
ncbi:flagellar protein FlaG [Priestia abyssalis]|uniref:flagellar protein FlaG n=1 Tax=Priestia abyssalis TaxID=1221450 RepID=UPI000994A7DE|nr:flagellar protein FlaG [Priestia abyssalis]